MKNKNPKSCLIEDCPSHARSGHRGVCIRHYELMRRTVNQGIHTWEEFVDYGMIEPAHYTQKGVKQKLLETMIVKKRMSVVEPPEEG